MGTDILKPHWRMVAGVVALAWAAVGALGNIDVVAGLFNEPGFVRDMISWLMNPPGWAMLVAIVAGLGLVYWDTKRRGVKAVTKLDSVDEMEAAMMREAEPQPPPMYPNSILVAALQMNLGRTHQPAPWLDFHGTGFNGSPNQIEFLSALGRVRVSGVEFSADLSLSNAPLIVKPYSLFFFTLNLALNDKGAEFIINFEHDYSVAFINARLVFMRDVRVINPEGLPRYELPLPHHIAFKRSGGMAEPQPSYLMQARG